LGLGGVRTLRFRVLTVIFLNEGGFQDPEREPEPERGGILFFTENRMATVVAVFKELTIQGFAVATLEHGKTRLKATFTHLPEGNMGFIFTGQGI